MSWFLLKNSLKFVPKPNKDLKKSTVCPEYLTVEHVDVTAALNWFKPNGNFAEMSKIRF